MMMVSPLASDVVASWRVLVFPFVKVASITATLRHHLKAFMAGYSATKTRKTLPSLSVSKAATPPSDSTRSTKRLQRPHRVCRRCIRVQQRGSTRGHRGVLSRLPSLFQIVFQRVVVQETLIEPYTSKNLNIMWNVVGSYNLNCVIHPGYLIYLFLVVVGPNQRSAVNKPIFRIQESARRISAKNLSVKVPPCPPSLFVVVAFFHGDCRSIMMLGAEEEGADNFVAG